MKRFDAVQTLRTAADLIESNGYAEAKRYAAAFIQHGSTGWGPVLRLIELMERTK